MYKRQVPVQSIPGQRRLFIPFPHHDPPPLQNDRRCVLPLSLLFLTTTPIAACWRGGLKKFLRIGDVRFFTMGTCFLEAAICAVSDQYDDSRRVIGLQRSVLCRWAMMVVNRSLEAFEVLQKSARGKIERV